MSAIPFLGIDRAVGLVQRLRYGNRFIRAVHYHATCAFNREAFREQLNWYRQHFSPVSQLELADFLQNGKWLKEKPGIIISFDDGLRCNYDVAAPLLMEYGFIGWFFVPTDFVDAPSSDQREFAKEHRIAAGACAVDRAPDGRLAMSWHEIRDLDKNHVIGSHSKTHRRMSLTMTPGMLDEEIVQSKLVLEDKLQHTVDSFAWVGGEEDTYTPAAAKAIVDAGYKFGFMTNSYPILPNTDPFRLQRTNVGTNWPVERVRVQTSGCADMWYVRKRARVNRITNTQCQV